MDTLTINITVGVHVSDQHRKEYGPQATLFFVKNLVTKRKMRKKWTTIVFKKGIDGDRIDCTSVPLIFLQQKTNRKKKQSGWEI